KKASITEKIAALAPMPSASDATAKSVTADAFASVRNAYRMSSRIVVMASPLRLLFSLLASRSLLLAACFRLPASRQPQRFRRIDTGRAERGKQRGRRADQQQGNEHLGEHSSVGGNEPEDAARQQPRRDVDERKRQAQTGERQADCSREDSREKPPRRGAQREPDSQLVPPPGDSLRRDPVDTHHRERQSGDAEDGEEHSDDANRGDGLDDSVPERTERSQGQIRVQLPDGSAHRLSERVRVGLRAQRDRDALSRRLIQREVDARRRLEVKPVLPYVFDDADDCRPSSRRGPASRSSFRPDPDPLSDGVSVGERLARDAAADERNGRGARSVARVEVPTCEERDSKSPEIARGGILEPGGRKIALARRSFAVDLETH